MTIEEIKKELADLKLKIDALNQSVSVLEDQVTKEAEGLESDIGKLIEES